MDARLPSGRPPRLSASARRSAWRATGGRRPKARDAATTLIRKRSVSLKGHATSVSLEDEYWAELKRMAEAAGLSLGALVERIDSKRGAANLSSALRLAVLADLKTRP